MWYRKIFILKNYFKIIVESVLAYMEWFNDILVSRKSKIFIKTFLYFTLPILILLEFGFLDGFLNKELLRTYNLVYKEPKNFFKDYVKVNIEHYKSKEELSAFLKSLSEYKPKLVVLDTYDNISVPRGIRFIKTVSLPIDLKESPKSWELNYSSSLDRVSFLLQNGIMENLNVSLSKNIYSGGFLLVENNLDFKYYIKTKNRFYYSLPLAIVKGIESWDTAYLKDDILLAHKLKDNKTRSIKIADGEHRLNPFHDFSKIKLFNNDLKSLKSKILVISDTKNKNINLAGFDNISRADYIILATQEIYKNDSLPKISKALIIFLLILLLSLASILNLLYKKRHRTLIFLSVLFFFVGLSFFFMKVAQLYLGFVPIMVPYIFAYLYGFFFTNRDDVSMSKGRRDLVLISVDFIALDRQLNELKEESEIRDLYSVMNIMRQKVLSLKSANAVVESFDYSNIVFFLLEKDNRLYRNFWESLETFMNDLKKLSKNYKNINLPRILGIEGVFYFYPEDNFWTGTGKDLFYKIRKHTKESVIFDVNIIPNGHLSKEYKEVIVDGIKLYGRNI